MNGPLPSPHYRPFWFSSHDLQQVTLPPRPISDVFVAKNPAYNGLTKLDLRPMHPSQWIQIDHNHAEAISTRSARYRASPREVCACTHEGEAGAYELLESVAEYLPIVYPQLFRRERGSIVSSVNGARMALDSSTAEAALVKVGRLIAEDCILLHSKPGTLAPPRVVGGCVAFVYDEIQRVMGKCVQEMHAEVTGLNESLGTSIDVLLDRLKPSRPLERVNVQFFRRESFKSEILSGEASALELTTKALVESHILVTNERQTITRLPLTGDIVFFDRMQKTRLKDASSALAKQCLAVMQTVPEGYHRERSGLDEAEFAFVLEALRERALAI